MFRKPLVLQISQNPERDDEELIVEEVSFKELKCAELQKNALFIDVRTEEEYENFHLDNFILIPLPKINADDVKELLQELNKTHVYLLCRSGNRSKRAAEILLSAGLTNVYNIQGGLLRYQKDEFGEQN